MTIADCSKATVEWKLHFCQKEAPLALPHVGSTGSDLAQREQVICETPGT